jgi:hypothetical protein
MPQRRLQLQFRGFSGRPVASKHFMRFFMLSLALLLVGIFCLSSTTAKASAPPTRHGLTLQVKAGFDGHYRDRNWIPLFITVHNSGPDFSGTLSADSPESPTWRTTFSMIPISAYRATISVPHGEARQATIYLPVVTFFSVASVSVRLIDSQGNVLITQSAPLQALDSEDVFVGLLSHRLAGFDTLQTVPLPNQNGSMVIQSLDTQTMPDLAAVMNNFDMILLDTFTTSSLSSSQIHALQTWVNQGGTLVEVGGRSWQQTLGGLPADLVPVSVHGSALLPPGVHLLPTSGPTIGSVNGTSDTDDTLQSAVPVSVASLKAGAQLELSSNGIPLLASLQQGQGHVYYLAYDPSQEPLVDWPGARALWKGLVIRTRGDLLFSETFGVDQTVGAPYEVAKLQRVVLPDKPQFPWLLVIFFVVYLLVLGPLRWLTIRKMNLRAWNWRIILSIIALFSLINYGVAVYQQSISVRTNSFTLIELNNGGSFAHSTAYLDIYEPYVVDGGNVQIHVPDGTLTTPFAEPTIRPMGVVVTHQSDGTQVQVSGALSRHLDALQTEQDLPIQGKLVSHLALGQGMVSGTITNTTSLTLRDVYVLLSHTLVRVGDLMPGQTRQIKLAVPSQSPSGGLSLCDSITQQLGVQTSAALYRFFFLRGALSSSSSSPSSRAFSMPTNEQQRHTSLLAFMFAALHCNHSPLVATGSSATLMGWADQPQGVANDLRINSIHPAGQHETLLVSPLDISYAAGPQVLPPDMLPGSLVDVRAVSMRRVSQTSYALAKGQATFEYTLPASSHLHPQTLTLNQPADGFLPRTDDLTLPNTHVALYNWQTASWDIVHLTQSTSFTTQDVGAYLSADGRLLVQYVNQQNGLADMTFARPTLTITGNVGK